MKRGAVGVDNTQMDVAPARPMWPIWALAVAMLVAAAAMIGASIADLQPLEAAPIVLPWWLLAAGFALAESRAVDLHYREEVQTFSLNEIVLVLGLFLVAPWGLVAAHVVGAALVLLLQRRSVAKIVFNVGQFALCTSVAILVFRALAGSAGPFEAQSWFAALAAACASAVLSGVVIAIAVTIAEGNSAVSDHLLTFVFGLVGALANTMLALVMVIVLWQAPWAALLLVGPIVVVSVAYRAYLSEHSKREGLQFLYNASQLTNRADDLEDGLLALLDFARDTFHAEFAEIVIAGDDDDVAYRTAAGPGTAMRRMEAVSHAMLDALPTLATPAFVDADSLASVDARDGYGIGAAMLAPLVGSSGLRGVVLVAKSQHASLPFEKEALNLFETFANHLGVMLEKNQLSNSLAQLHQVKQELSHQAFHDSLTGLANRALFRDRVEEALANAGGDSGLAVLFIDLDDFKTVNDTMGHAAGDYLLQVVGDRIAACVGDGDTPARLGGDEFAVLLPGVAHDADVRVIADRILVALGDPVEIDGQLVVAPASIGIAMHAQAMDAAELMQNADVAMYTAKRNGKGRFDMFEKTMSLSVAHRHQVKMGLERAIANGELVVHYQPVVDTVTSQIVAAEALVRWQDPVRGLLPPSEFVEIAEESGLIIAIGRFVLEEACRQTKQWSAVAPGLRVFVNLSTRQLADPDLFDVVAAALHTSGLEPSQLVLEVTETTMMQDIDLARETLARLKQLGVGIAIDDFGTGYSSLSYLRQLPIDTLKIAKEFIDAVDHTDEDAAFVGGIVKLGHMIGLQVVAEGVERVEQAARLIDMGCDMAQGYYYSRSSEPTGLDHLLGAIEQASGERSVSSVTQ
ncbi:MAG: EAL domain-containing protein [Actinomycetota bacterium]|nr:EAL domain-containing protein [Actinomycetota bacterium]